MPIGQTELFRVPKWFDKAENIHDAVNTGATALRFINFASDLSARIEMCAFIGVGAAIFAIPNLIRSIHKTIVSNTAIDRITHAVKAFFSAGASLESITFCVDGLKSVGVIAQEACSWTLAIYQALYPLQFLSLAWGSYEMQGVARLRLQMKKNIAVSKKQPLDTRVENLTHSFTYVRNTQDLRESLGISKSAGLDARMEQIAKKLLSENSVEKQKAVVEGEQLMKALKRRINTKLTLNILSTVAKIATIVVLGFLLFTTPTTPVFALVATVMSIALALLAAEKLFINKDPLSQPRDVWYAKAAHAVRQGVYRGIDALYKPMKKGIGCK